MKFRVFSLLLLIAAYSNYSSAASQAESILRQSISAMKKVRTLEATLERKERFGDCFIRGELHFKLQVNPRRVYLYSKYPNEGAEVIYKEGWNGGKAYVNPNGFPFVNLSLPPEGAQLMKDQHHSVKLIGFGFINKVIQVSMRKYLDRIDDFVTYEGEMSWHGKQCHVLSIDFSEWSYSTYKVEKKCSLLDLERNLCVNACLICEKNGLKPYSYVKPGQELTIPNVYAKKTRLLIQSSTMLPIGQELYDEKGLFERYHFKDVVVNPVFTEEDFSTKNDQYDF